jgi:regulator of cell morphogenesis and NO signaling
MTTATQTVREIAQTQPSSIHVFEQFGIEYCCGGGRPLGEACAAKEVDVNRVIAALEAASHSLSAQLKDWRKEALSRLIEHIVVTHHAYCKGELPRLAGLAAKVVNRHGGTNPELALIRSKVAELAEELTEHLADEEVFVFPMIANLEQKSRNLGRDSGQTSSSVGNPIALLVQDHDRAGVLMAEIRSLSRDFKVPGYACTSFRALYDGLRHFEEDLHRHVHLENNILFPRAIELEAAS